jgi:hypothetical protein
LNCGFSLKREYIGKAKIARENKNRGTKRTMNATKIIRYILKACLVLSGFSDISFKVDNFNRSNMLVIEPNWDELTNARVCSKAIRTPFVK